MVPGMSAPEPFGPAERAEMERIWNTNELLRQMGARVDLSEAGCLRLHIDPILPTQRGGLGTAAVNGAVLSGLCDVLVGLNGILYSRKYGTGTVQLNIQFLRPLRGNSLLGEARATKVGRA